MKLRLVLTVMILSGMLGIQNAWAMQNYGPTRANETLWSIASAHHPARVTVEQTALAIVKLNPRAFQGADYVLKPRSYLRLPTTSSEVKSALGLRAAASAQSRHKAVSHTKPTHVNKTAISTRKRTEQLAVERPVVERISRNAVNNESSYEAQVAQLQQQLAAANQQAALLRQQLDSNTASFPWASLWFILWMLTSISLYMVYRHYRNAEKLEEQDLDLSEQIKKTRGKTEPIIISVSEKEPENPFEQGELDIPSDENILSQSGPEENAKEESAEASEQAQTTPEIQSLLRQIETDPYNLELRMELLELYSSVSDQAGFNEQTRDMLNHNLMMEGDEVWTKVRALYLNTWIYA